jgi:hypothetical protein
MGPNSRNELGMLLEEQEMCCEETGKRNVNLALLTHAPISAISLECQIICAASGLSGCISKCTVEQKTRLQIVVMEVLFACQPFKA